jgi:hypothetical protein
MKSSRQVGGAEGLAYEPDHQTPVRIFSRGTVIALFVAAHSGVEPFAFWQQQKMPDAVAFALPGLKLERSAQRTRGKD